MKNRREPSVQEVNNLCNVSLFTAINQTHNQNTPTTRHGCTNMCKHGIKRSRVTAVTSSTFSNKPSSYIYIHTPNWKRNAILRTRSHQRSLHAVRCDSTRTTGSFIRRRLELTEFLRYSCLLCCPDRGGNFFGVRFLTRTRAVGLQGRQQLQWRAFSPEQCYCEHDNVRRAYRKELLRLHTAGVTPDTLRQKPPSLLFFVTPIPTTLPLLFNSSFSSEILRSFIICIKTCTISIIDHVKIVLAFTERSS